MMTRSGIRYSPIEPGSGSDPSSRSPGSDYLWDGSGEPDPRIARLERVMGELRLTSPLTLPARSGGEPAPAGPGEAEAALHREGVRTPRDHRRRKNAWILPAAGMVALFAIVGFIGWPMRPWGPGTQRPPESDPGDGSASIGGDPGVAITTWQASHLTGAPVIGARMLSSPRPLATNDWLTTDAVSRARLVDDGVGTITVEPNSSVRVTRVLNGQHWFELAKGRIEATIHAPPKLFFVRTRSALAVDMGCAYTLETDELGNGELHVTLGWVELQRDGRTVRVPSGKKCVMIAGVGPGTPIDDAASQFMIAAVARFDDRASQKSPSAALDDVLSSAGADDGVTLWHVLRQVDEPDRRRVVEKLASIVPPPGGISTDALLKLDPVALDQWWNDIRYR